MTFRDLRFLYPGGGMLGGRTPLMGVVYINPDRHVDHMELDGRDQP